MGEGRGPGAPEMATNIFFENIFPAADLTCIGVRGSGWLLRNRGLGLADLESRRIRRREKH